MEYSIYADDKTHTHTT